MSGEHDDDDERTVFHKPPGSEGTPQPGPGSGGAFAPLGTPPSPPQSPAQHPAPPPLGVAPDPFAPINPPLPPGASARSGQIAVGDVLNGIYRITRFIARGGMGEVYEGVNIHSAGERVAVKVMLSNLASDELVMAMFAKEASTLTRLHHEAIVPYRLAARDPEGRPFIVTEYVDGPSLEQRLGAVRLTDEQFGELTRRLARGLGAAHALGAIHRDVAPDNVLLVDGDPLRPKIIDFGIARDAREQTGTIVGDGFAGKLKYVAPEQLGEYGRRIGPWTDLYSLALTLLAVASGRHTDMGGSIADAVRKRMSVPDISAIPERYRAAFQRALQPDPAFRPQSMGDFISLLYEAEQGGGGLGFAPLEERPQTNRPTPIPAKAGAGAGPLRKLAALVPDNLPGGRWALLGGLGALVLVVGIVTLVVVTSGDDAPTETAASNEPKTDPEAGPVEPGSLQFAALASSLSAGAPCSWLTFAGSDASVARFVGGAGNVAASQDAIADGLAAKGAGGVTLDMGEVVPFTQPMCGAIDAIREFRSQDALVSSPQRTYEAEEQAILLSNGATFGEGRFAKPLFRVEGLRQGEDLVFVVIEAAKAMQPLFIGREEGAQAVEMLSGTVNPDGFDVPYPAELVDPPKESYGIAVIAGKGPFPPELFGSSLADNALVPLDAGWPDRFREEARAKGWRTDIFWFSVTDEVPG